MPARWASVEVNAWFEAQQSSFLALKAKEDPSTATDKLLLDYWDAFPALDQLFNRKYKSVEELTADQRKELDEFVNMRNAVSDP
jgi:hypothetical protein